MADTGAPLNLSKNVDGENARTALSTDLPANMQAINDAIVTLADTQTISGRKTLSHANGLALSAAASKIVPGATSLSLRNNADAADNIIITDAGVATVRAGLVVTAGNSYLGDTANAKMTLGLTINQGAADDEALALKSSDVAHGMTTIAETDTYGLFMKTAATTGGLEIIGLGEASDGIKLLALPTTVDATKSAAAVGATCINAFKANGTGIAAVDANTNLVVVQSAGSTFFILDSDGDSHQDVGTAWTNFDDHDDLALLTALSVQVSRPDDPIKRAFREYIEAHRETLEKAKLVTFNDDGHHFVNMSRLSMLLVGAVRQMGQKNADLTGRLAAIEQRLTLLPGV
jgi:hypothetical protein